MLNTRLPFFLPRQLCSDESNNTITDETHDSDLKCVPIEHPQSLRYTSALIITDNKRRRLRLATLYNKMSVYFVLHLWAKLYLFRGVCL